MKEKMKILFCIDSMTKGGAERVISNLSNYLINNGYDVNILTVVNSDIEYDINLNVKLECLEDKFINVRNEKNGKIKKISNFVKRIKLMKKAINKINPDIIISFLPYTSFITLKAIKDIPTIVSIRNDPKIEYSSKIYNFLMKKLYPRADGFVYQTEDAKQYFKNIINVKSAIIPNPINEQFIVSQEFQGERKKEIVSVGRLFQQKNHQLLIESFADLSDELLNYNLIIYGEGEDREKLQRIIKEKKLENRIFLPGNIKDVKEKIFDAKMFVLSSDYEGMPNALMEAMALGIPVIATDCPCGGPKFLIDNNNNGILIDVGDKEQLKNAILKIIKDTEFSKKISHNAIEISQKLAPEKINKKWEDFIVEIYKEINYKEKAK